jgi:5-methylcytosine-specific restriction endonuclease McrA
VPARASIAPTSEARYRIQLNASAALKEKLELFKALVSHSVPSGDIAAVLERALDLALEQAQKQRFAKTERPRSRRTRMVKRASQHREHIPNAVQREVAARDGLRCTYVSEGGCRCSARAFLQIHHEEPWARGGAPTTENLRLLCASHNRLLAERDFGAAHVAERRAARRCSDAQRSLIKARVQQDGHHQELRAKNAQTPWACSQNKADDLFTLATFQSARERTPSALAGVSKSYAHAPPTSQPVAKRPCGVASKELPCFAQPK